MKRIVVIGGGLAGITAALDCAKSGASVTLLESRGRLGGAAYSFTRNGLQLDNGQHVFLRCCSEYQALLGELGASHLVTLQEQLSIPVLAPGRRAARLARTQLPAPLHLTGALLRYPFLGIRQLLALGRAVIALQAVDPDDPAADAQSFGSWLARHGQDSELMETVWELIGRPTLNLRADDASLAQAAFVFQQGLLSDKGAGDVGYAKVPLGDIHDLAARDALAHAGVVVRVRHGVSAVRPTGPEFEIEGSTMPTMRADAVVLAVGQERAAKLLPAAAGIDAGALATLGSSPIVNLHAVYDRPVLDEPFAAGVHTPVQWVFDRTIPAGLRRGQYLAISLSAADDELGMSCEQLRARFEPALAELLPGARSAQLQEFIVTREHAATFRAAPGSRALRPGARTALPGLFLAGAWTDTGWPATMEGAVRSGRLAAREALSGPAATRERGVVTLQNGAGPVRPAPQEVVA
jgi:squalene-associated FAD-dependent desaturase